MSEKSQFEQTSRGRAGIPFSQLQLKRLTIPRFSLKIPQDFCHTTEYATRLKPTVSHTVKGLRVRFTEQRFPLVCAALDIRVSTWSCRA